MPAQLKKPQWWRLEPQLPPEWGILEQTAEEGLKAHLPWETDWAQNFETQDQK